MNKQVSQFMNQFLGLLFLGVFSLSLFACSSSGSKVGDAPQIDSELSSEEKAAEVAKKVKEETLELVQEHELYHYPALTFLISTKDVPSAVEKVEEAGGEVLYNPNFNEGSAIPFLVVNLTPEKLVDEDFIKGLKPEAAKIDHPLAGNRLEIEQVRAPHAFTENIFVPINDIRVPELREKAATKGLGEDVTVAIIDSGVDASHPIFQDRVVFWYDATEETRQQVSELATKNAKVTIAIKDKETKLELPALIQSAPKVYGGVISEKAITAQNSFADRLKDNEGMDLNQNGKRDDEFAIVLAEAEFGQDPDLETALVAYIDANANGEFDEEEIENPILDFNALRVADAASEISKLSGVLSFPARNRILEFPLMIETDSKEASKPVAVSLGFSDGSHGTHVAGIVAGDGEQIQGAAPRAKIMSLKVCSGISCTDQAILRGLIRAFYNPQGHIPQVVNISLGSKEHYEGSIYDILLRDLAAKFGATFVISASNNGPGYRSVNSLGTLAPVIHVGAHVSRRTRDKHYRLPDPQSMAADTMLFFSSAGPSFTGALKPHISAPGSALSATTLVDGRSQMYNGTSMSAPIVTGAVAAMLSVANEDPAYKGLRELQLNKGKAVQENASSEDSPKAPSGSMVDIPLAIRTALQESAKRMPDLTIVHQGFGLIQIDRALDKFLQKADTLAKGEAHLFEVALNGNSEAGRVFDRSLKMDRVKKIAVSLIDDGERTDKDVLVIQNTPIQVKLRKVEVEDNAGRVKTLTERMPFSIGIPGTEGSQANEDTLILTSRARQQFYSVRDLNRMKEGHTYIAHYDLIQNGARVLSVTDFVQIPYQVTESASEEKLPGLEVGKDASSFKRVFANRKITPLKMHRYPVAVEASDSQITVQLGMMPDAVGALYLQLYDSDGHEMGFALAAKSDEHTADMPVATLSVSTRNEDTGKRKTGIYEITVSAASREIVGTTAYTLKVSKTKFLPNKEAIALKLSGDSKVASSTLVVSHSDPEVKMASLKTDALVAAEYIDDYEVVPTKWVYRKLNFPQVEGQEKSSIDLHMGQKAIELSTVDAFYGRIDHRLYKLGKDGKTFEPAYKADTSYKGPRGSVRFKDIKLDEDLYMAVETLVFNPFAAGKKKASISIDVIYSDIKIETKAPVAKLDSAASTDDVSLVSVNGPEALPDGMAGAFQLLTLSSQKGASLSVPVRIRP